MFKNTFPARSRAARLTAVTLAALASASASAHAADLHATTANFTSTFAAAQPGDVIHLASGNYGTFTGGTKSGMVTITSEVGATPVMAVRFNPATYIRLDGLQLGDVEISNARTHDIQIANSNVTGQTTLRTGQLANANILLDHNVHANWDKCGNCNEARVWLPENTAQPSGITIQNSQFGPGGLSDGIQNGSNGTKILNNEFFDLEMGSVDGVHTDAIQLYGSKNTVIDGNYFHDVPDAIMGPDGTDHETITNNVFAADDKFDYPYAITLWSDTGSVIRHNTMLYGNCAFNLKCGLISLGAKSGQPTSTGTIIRDNIFTGIACCGDAGSAGYTADHNLVRQTVTGTANTNAAPTYTGGTHPTTFTGFALTTNSRGKGAATDGTDLGVDVTRSGPPKDLPGAGTPPPLTPRVPVNPLAPSNPPGGVGGGPFGTALVAAFGFDDASAAKAAAVTAGTTTSPGLELRRARTSPVAHSGRALAFRGGKASAILRGSTGLRLAHGATLEAWVRLTAPRAWRPVIALGRRGHVLTLFASDGRGHPAASASGKGLNPRARGKIRLGKWTHLATTYDGKVVRLYVDGELVRSRNRRGQLPLRGPLRIGSDTAGRAFHGQIDDVRVYDEVLDRAALQGDMKRSVTRG